MDLTTSVRKRLNFGTKQNEKSLEKKKIFRGQDCYVKFTKLSDDILQKYISSDEQLPDNTSTGQQNIGKKHCTVDVEGLKELEENNADNSQHITEGEEIKDAQENNGNVTCHQNVGNFCTEGSKELEKDDVDCTRKIMEDVAKTIPLKIKRNYTKKKEFCIFCKELKTNIARHFELCHQNEKEVLKFLRFEKKSAERIELISKLRKQGNFEYNIANPEKPILVRRRHAYGDPLNPREYFLPCPLCKAFLSNKQLSNHHKKCCNNLTQKNEVRSVKRDARVLISNIHPIANDILKYKIMAPMRNDIIFNTVKNDRLILLYGNHLTPKYIAHQEYIIRHRLRFLGRYFITVKKLCTDIKKMEHLFHPRHFEVAVKAVYCMGELKNTTGAFTKPKSALEMVQCLKVCAKILESTYIKEGKDTKRKNVNKFLKLLESESASRINKPAHRDLIATSRQNRIKKQKKIPLSADIIKFKSFIVDRAQHVYDQLSETFSYVLWKQLAELTLLFIVVYNRKRSGESHRILLEDYLNMQPLTTSALSEEFELLDDNEKERAQITYKLVIRGKLDRTVCAFVPQNIKIFLDYIFKFRAAAKVPEQNPYLFGLPGQMSGVRHKTLETCFLMRKYTVMANLRNPLHVRTTMLRKHLATKVSTLNLEDAQQETVHDFMGHHGNIHKGFYRQQIIKKDLLLNKILDTSSGMAPSTSGDTNDINKKTKTVTRNYNSHESTGDSENELTLSRNPNVIENTPQKIGKKDNTNGINKKTKTVTRNYKHDESTVDSENDIILSRNLSIIKNTPVFLE